MTRTLTLEEIYAPVEARLKNVPVAIQDILSTPNELAQEVVRHFFSAQGKLLRPALTLLGAEIKGAGEGIESRLTALAASFEIFHAATLIHDDIIDSAYLRRSIPTINVKWGPEVAVLVGDYLHDKAIGAIFTNGSEKIVSTFLHTAGTVCDGEIHELKEKGNFDLTEKEYLEIVDKKTAVLLACALECGGLLAGASEEEAGMLKRFGHAFGIAFQIIDDCLDFTGQEQEFGKTLGADCVAGVLTLPLIQLVQLDPKNKIEIRDIFKSEAAPAKKFETLFAMVREQGTLDYSLERAREYCGKARLELSVFRDGPGRQSLDRLLDYVIDRSR